jgi:hypothetical protein
MKRILFAMALLPAVALAEVPNIVGTWSGQTTASVYGSGGHHPEDLGSAFSFRPIEMTYVFEQQQGRNFYGKLTSRADSEIFVGTFSRDNKTGIMVDPDGRFAFDVYETNKMEICYGHPLGTGSSAVAACIELTRK